MTFKIKKSLLGLKYERLRALFEFIIKENRDVMILLVIIFCILLIFINLLAISIKRLI